MNSPGLEPTPSAVVARTRRWTALCFALLLILLLISKLESNSSDVLRWTDVLYWALLSSPYALVLLLLRPGAGFAAGAALSLNAATLVLFTFFSIMPLYYGIPLFLVAVLESTWPGSAVCMPLMTSCGSNG